MFYCIYSSRFYIYIHALFLCTILLNIYQCPVHSSHRQEEPLRGTGLKKFLPLGCVLAGEADGVDRVVELGANKTRPRLQLKRTTQERMLHYSPGGGDCRGRP